MPIDDNQLNKEETRQQVMSALSNPDIPHIYFNGFINSIGLGDIMVILTQSVNQVAVLNMSYTVAKTLVEKIGASIAEIENKSGNTILTTDDIKRFFVEDDDETE